MDLTITTSHTRTTTYAAITILAVASTAATHPGTTASAAFVLGRETAAAALTLSGDQTAIAARIASTAAFHAGAYRIHEDPTHLSTAFRRALTSLQERSCSDAPTNPQS